VLLYSGRWGSTGRGMSLHGHSWPTPHVISMYLCKSTVEHPCACEGNSVPLHKVLHVAPINTCVHVSKDTRTPVNLPAPLRAAQCSNTSHPLQGTLLWALTCPATDVGCCCLVQSSCGTGLQGVLASRGQSREGEVVGAAPERGRRCHGAQPRVVQGQRVAVSPPGRGSPGRAQPVRVPRAQQAHGGRGQRAWGANTSHCQEPRLGCSMLQDMGQPGKVPKALPLTPWQLPPGIASSLVLWVAVGSDLGRGWQGCGVMSRLPVLHQQGTRTGCCVRGRAREQPSAPVWPLT